MRAIYLDCFCGISGAMLLGALCEAGVPAIYVEQELQKLPVSGFLLTVRAISKQGLNSCLAEFSAHQSDLPDSLHETACIVARSSLSAYVKNRFNEIVDCVTAAETKLLPAGSSVYKGYDKTEILGIISSLIGLEYLGIQHIAFSPLHVGSGFVESPFGLLPVPSPVTSEILSGIPFYSTVLVGELVTPLGAALVATLGSQFGSLPTGFHSKMIAYGAGKSDLAVVNVLRVYVGEIAVESDHCNVKVVETNIDDLNPQIYGYVMERLFAAGASDVYLTALVMKKGRPGTKLTVIVQEKYLQGIVKIMFAETSTVGMRIFDCDTVHLERIITSINTQWGPVRVKTGKIGDEVLNVSPEYEDLKRIAQENNISLKQIYATILGETSTAHYRNKRTEGVINDNFKPDIGS